MSLFSGNEIVLSKKSVHNIIKELGALRDIYTSDNLDEELVRDVINEGLDRMIYNMHLLFEGAEYLNDDLSYIAEEAKEIE